MVWGTKIGAVMGSSLLTRTPLLGLRKDRNKNAKTQKNPLTLVDGRRSQMSEGMSQRGETGRLHSFLWLCDFSVVDDGKNPDKELIQKFSNNQSARGVPLSCPLQY